MDADSQEGGGLLGGATEIASDQLSGLIKLLEGLYVNDLSCTTRQQAAVLAEKSLPT